MVGCYKQRNAKDWFEQRLLGSKKGLYRPRVAAKNLGELTIIFHEKG